MAKKQPTIRPAASRIGPNQVAQPSIPAEAALSFLKDTKGAVTWSVRDLADSLKTNLRGAEQVVELLAAQGYVQRETGTNDWMTTLAGESVSGAKTPRFARESVEKAVDALKERINQINKDSKTAFRITDAVAFGDFLLKDRARVQPADVGIGLVQRGAAAGEGRSVFSAKAERQFLRHLRGKTALFHCRPYADWMRQRSSLDLL
jgi:DNA-binding transcriptional regulator YhcF (GntR family)